MANLSLLTLKKTISWKWRYEELFSTSEAWEKKLKKNNLKELECVRDEQQNLEATPSSSK